MRTITRKRTLRLTIMIGPLLAAPSVYAEDSTAPPAACARELDESAIKDIIKSNGSVDARTQRVVDLAKGSVVDKWSSITRPQDVEKVISDVAKQLIAKIPTPLTKELEGPAAKGLAQQMFDALNAACATQTQDVASMNAAAAAAAQLPPAPAAAAAAAVEAVGGPTTNIKSSGDAYGVGDRLRFATVTDGFALVVDSQPGARAVAPCGAKFRITNVDKTGEIVLGYFYSVPLEDDEPPRVGGRKCKSTSVPGERVEPDRDYQIAADRLARAPAYASGWQFGVLVAPYKFHFSDDSTTPSATIGGYFGFQYGSPAVSVTPVFSVGLGAVTETKAPATEGEETEEGTEPKQGTLATLSAAAGVLFKIRKADGFTIGLLLGSDWTGQKERYRYDGKLWAAVSIGMSITE